jgi:hypothetical protein
MIMGRAFSRDIQIINSIFSIYNQKMYYIQVYLIFCHTYKNTKLFKDELEILRRYLWKYQYSTLNEFSKDTLNYIY